MPLIKCPMCEKDISPNAVSCPHCGEPLKKSVKDESIKTYKLILKELNKTKHYLDVLMKELDYNPLDVANAVKNTPCIIKKGLSYQDAYHVKEIFEEVQGIIEVVADDEYTEFPELIVANLGRTKEDSTLITKGIKCPNCNHEKTHKISGVSKAGSVAMFGLFSIGKVNKTWQCDKCGYRW